MTTKTKKARRRKAPVRSRLALRRDAEALCLRQADLSVRAGTLNEEQRSVRIVLATETPVRVFDWDSWDVVDEVLLMDGLETPRQLPMLDSHFRSTNSVIGSIRDLAKVGQELEGTAVFARSDEGQRVFDLVRDGHLTDFSIGFRAMEVERVKKGETATIAGRKFKGPVRVVTRAQAKEGSAVAIGADPNAKARGASEHFRAYTDPDSLREEMNELKSLCLRLGMPEDTDNVMEWLTRHLEANPQPKSDKGESLLPQILEAVRQAQQAPPPKPEQTPPVGADDGEAVKRTLEIVELCERNGIDAKQRKEWIDGKLTPDQVARKILEARQEERTGQPLGAGGIEHTGSERERFFQAASTVLAMRAMQGAGVKPQAALDRARAYGDFDAVQRCQAVVDLYNKPPEGMADLRHAGLIDMARAYVEMHGQRTAFWPRERIAREAIRMSNLHSMRSDTAYNTTGSFNDLMLDAANKTLLMAYDEAAVTYPIWVRTAPSAADFKALNRIRFGELPDPEVVPENHPYPEKQTSDERESYRVEKHGMLFSISFEAIVNDDLNAISRIPAMQGNAMRRKINKSVYSILTSNPNLADGVALFHATSHGANLDGSALAVTALDVGYKVMMQQAGLTSGTILNIMPRYLIVPAALSATALQIRTSTADPAAGGSAAGNSNTANIYGPGGPRDLVVVVEGQLDASTTQAWWLAADSSQVDTIELTFLQGEESPVLSREDGFEVDSVKYKIRQTFGVKAIDYRGLYQGQALA